MSGDAYKACSRALGILEVVSGMISSGKQKGTHLWLIEKNCTESHSVAHRVIREGQRGRLRKWARMKPEARSIIRITAEH